MKDSEFPIGMDFLKQYDLVIFERGQYLWKRGDEIKYLYYVQSGICAAIEWQFNGALYIPLFFHKNELIGVLTVLGEKVQRISRNDIVARTQVHVYRIPIDDARHYIHSNFEVYKKATYSVLNSEAEMISLAQMKIRGNSAAIVCTALVTLKEIKKRNNFYYVPACFNITDIANNLQMHRVTVSKIMKCLCEKEILKKEAYGWSILDIDELEQYASGEKILENVYRN